MCFYVKAEIIQYWFILFKIRLKLNLSIVKTITIRDEVSEKLCMLKGDVPLSDLIEKMIVGGKGIEVLKKIRERLANRQGGSIQ